MLRSRPRRGRRLEARTRMPSWACMPLCADGSFDTGCTTDLDTRVGQHQAGTLGGYTAMRRPVELVWAEEFQHIDDAIAAERRIKGWSRAKKKALIAGDWPAIQRLASRAKETPADRSGLVIVLRTRRSAALLSMTPVHSELALDSRGTMSYITLPVHPRGALMRRRDGGRGRRLRSVERIHRAREARKRIWGLSHIGISRSILTPCGRPVILTARARPVHLEIIDLFSSKNSVSPVLAPACVVSPSSYATVDQGNRDRSRQGVGCRGPFSRGPSSGKQRSGYPGPSGVPTSRHRVPPVVALPDGRPRA